MRIEVVASAASALDQIADSIGMTHVAIHSRMIEWLADQPDVVQAGVLGLLPANSSYDIVRLALKYMAAKPRPLQDPSSRDGSVLPQPVALVRFCPLWCPLPCPLPVPVVVGAVLGVSRGESAVRRTSGRRSVSD
jgi:hypothetical protein